MRLDQYTAQSPGVSLQNDPPGPLEKGAEPTGAQIHAAIESSRQAMQTQIATIAVDVNLLRADLRVVAERSVATEKQVTCLQSETDTLKDSVAILKAKTHKLEARVEDAEAKLKVLHAGRSHFFPSPEAAWDWLERNGVWERRTSWLERVAEGPEGQRRCILQPTCRCCAGQGSQVIVRSDSALGLERHRQEREEAKLLVQTVTSETSSRSGSPCVVGRLTPDSSPQGT
ncbi:hypothetical protein NDU88_005598 [Pleurodeles waltl]|uniref:Uncharacterized protein n=1 Tax=Pleurodeles waltl TaxID=8319 RepID=A0AAV7TXR5_PLEWA|nr:hypothetical protein NDU88_005598 [Pleurodeles waltl]